MKLIANQLQVPPTTPILNPIVLRLTATPCIILKPATCAGPALRQLTTSHALVALLARSLRACTIRLCSRTRRSVRPALHIFPPRVQFLGKTTDPNHKQYYYVLENMADLQAFLICMDIDAWDVITDLFSMCFDTITSEHSMQIQSCFLTIMRDVVTNAVRSLRARPLRDHPNRDATQK